MVFWVLLCLWKNCKIIVIIFWEVLLKNSPFPVPGIRAAIGIAIFLDWIICLLSEEPEEALWVICNKMCNFIPLNSFPLGLEKGNNHFSTIWSAASQVMGRMLFPAIPSSHSGSAQFHSEEEMGFSGILTQTRIFLLHFISSGSWGAGIGFHLACILVFNFPLTETQERTTCASLLLLRSTAISTGTEFWLCPAPQGCSMGKALCPAWMSGSFVSQFPLNRVRTEISCYF